MNGVVPYHKEISQWVSLHAVVSELLTWNSPMRMLLIRILYKYTIREDKMEKVLNKTAYA